MRPIHVHAPTTELGRTPAPLFYPSLGFSPSLGERGRLAPAEAGRAARVSPTIELKGLPPVGLPEEHWGLPEEHWGLPEEQWGLPEEQWV